jgi:hypothetical protein
MSDTVWTCNMAEALYLLEHGNRVVKVGLVNTWPYGLEELAVFFDGSAVEADHERYIKSGIPADLSGLPELFAAVSALLSVKGGAA